MELLTVSIVFARVKIGLAPWLLPTFLLQQMDAFDEIASRVPGPGVDPEHFNTDLEGCACIGECTASSGCSCLWAKEDNYDSVGRLLHSPSSSSPLMECSDNCECALNEKPCGNRVSQLGIRCKLELVEKAGKGHGVVAEERITRGTFVSEYAGEVISREEAVKRSKEMTSSPHQYIYTVNEHIKGSIRPTYFDARWRGNLTRFINHSCDPNLFPQVLRRGSVTPHLCLFALRDINEGEELSYSYGPVISSNNGGQGKLCLCGASNCKGVLPASEF